MYMGKGWVRLVEILNEGDTIAWGFGGWVTYRTIVNTKLRTDLWKAGRMDNA